MHNNNQNNKLRPVEFPFDASFYERPFFAYGIFKKGQLAYSKIEDLVEEVYSDDIPRKMYIKDGIPLIVNEYDENHRSCGHKIYFHDKKEAYRRISNTEPGNIYYWGIIEINGKEFNILFGKNTNGTFLNVDENGDYLDTFDGSEDPFFTKVTPFIRSELEELDYLDENSIFKLQMYYMLLWSAIDRYCSLKYDVFIKQGEYLYELSSDKLYLDALEELKIKEQNSIYSARDGRPFYFNRNRPNFIINYYYTIRCNIVHRGKEAGNNISILRRSLQDLLNIFDYIVENTFKKEDID